MAGKNARKFAKVLEPHFAPVLRGDGFAPQGSGWIRVRDPVINWLDVQSRSDDEACCVNLGVHFTFLPRGSSGLIAVSDIRTGGCMISDRLTWEGEHDHWWLYDDEERAAADLVACYEERGRAWFDKYAAFPHPLVDVAPEDFDSKSLDELLPRAAGRIFLLAHLHDYLGNGALAVHFCEIGRATVPKTVSGARYAFNELLKKYGIRVQGR